MQANTLQRSTSWSSRYGERHHLERVTDFPRGIVPPKKVRIYWRHDHYVLQWWDPAAKCNLSDRPQGDLIAAIMRARQIEDRLQNFKSGGTGRQAISHRELCEKYLADLRKRADASEIDTRTVARYQSALKHFLSFCEQRQIERAYPSVTRINRDFALLLGEYLANLLISPNGHPKAVKRRMSSTKYVEDVVRAMLAWGADPERGNLLPEGFRNPLLGSRRRSNEAVRDLFGEPDITLSMAVDFVNECDKFQLRLFGSLMLYGLRASEPCFLFHEHIEDGWLSVTCDPNLNYFVKGRRDKRFPLIQPLNSLLVDAGTKPSHGLIFQRRSVLAGTDYATMAYSSRAVLRTEYEQRCRNQKAKSAAELRQVRDQLMSDAGSLSYDNIEGEFHDLARRLRWPRAATLKDFRHLFSSSLENAGMPEFYRRYFMGQSPGKSAVVNYTHLNQLRERYSEAMQHQFRPLLEAIQLRIRQLEEECTDPCIATRSMENTGRD